MLLYSSAECAPIAKTLLKPKTSLRRKRQSKTNPPQIPVIPERHLRLVIIEVVETDARDPLHVHRILDHHTPVMLDGRRDITQRLVQPSYLRLDRYVARKPLEPAITNIQRR